MASTPRTIAKASGKRAEACPGGLPLTALAGSSVRRPLVGARVAEDAEECQRDDLEIEAQRPVLDVVEVVLDATIERRVATESVDLRPARHARFHVMAEHVARDLRAELIDVR